MHRNLECQVQESGKLEVVKQEMARVNINILGIRELKWTGMGEFNSDDHYIYYCRQESLRRKGVAIVANKRVQNAVLGCNLKNFTECLRSKNLQAINAGEGVEKREPSYTVGGNAN